MNKTKVVLASGNRKKAKELTEAITAFDVIPQTSFGLNSIPEIGLTFVENALLKARHAAEKTGLSALADDSGLVVPALDGMPGLYSARYAGEKADAQANMLKLLDKMTGLDGEARKAYFVCVLVLLKTYDDPLPIIAQGIWHGTIATEPSGQQGFGYDPVFYIESLHCTAAMLTPEQKKQFSHRGQAIRDLQYQLSNG